MTDNAHTTVPKRRQWLKTLSAFVAGAGAACLIWLLLRPTYIDLRIPMGPGDRAGGSRSFIALKESDWNGGGTYYIVRLIGHAREREGWTRQKAIAHFDRWLTDAGWSAPNGDQDGAGVFHDWRYNNRATHRRYVRQGDTRGAWVTVTVFDDQANASEGLRMWNVVVESVNPSWWTAFRRSLD